MGRFVPPIEVVDFIVKSADDALKSEFVPGLKVENVHIRDGLPWVAVFYFHNLERVESVS